jgi:hypothetical protein
MRQSRVILRLDNRTYVRLEVPMAARSSLLTIRSSAEERRLVAAVAQRLGLTEADTVRQIVAEKAQQLGVPVSHENRQPQRAGVST